ncbi:2Fe-2S iron-sulfur cluster-binding protein [Salinisphaera japonica]|uniref:2Fe-2S iron-sulfur cluster-binding protein n=1 Tax=Salinisphaera japonica TaxID=1304270 RepID=UPI003CCC7FB5
MLQIALGAGINYPHGCRSGRCGACKSRLVSGDVEQREHTEFALSPDERASGRPGAATDRRLRGLAGRRYRNRRPSASNSAMPSCPAGRRNPRHQARGSPRYRGSTYGLFGRAVCTGHVSRSAHPRLLDGQSRR